MELLRFNLAPGAAGARSLHILEKSRFEKRGKRAVESRAVGELFLAYLEAPSMLPKLGPERACRPSSV